MGSGGVASPTDPIWMNQYREDEIRAIVNECVERRSYVSAHCHPASAVRRCVEFGVRSIEHGTLIDDETARFVAEKGAYIVPTMVIISALVEMGRQLGFPAQSQEKAEYAWKQAISGMDLMRQAGVKICFGTDLMGSMYDQECREFTLRSEVFSPLEILRQATSIAGRDDDAWKARSAASRPARMPTCWWSTATRSRTSRCWPPTAATCAPSCAAARSSRTSCSDPPGPSAVGRPYPCRAWVGGGKHHGCE